MKKEFKLQKMNIAQTMTKMKTLILCELLNGKSHTSIFKTLISSGYKLKNEEAVRSIIRKLKKEYKVNSLFQLGAFYALDIAWVDNTVLMESLGKLELQNEEQKKKIDGLTYENLDLINKMVEMSNKYEEEKIIAFNSYQLLEDKHQENLSKKYGEGFGRGIRECRRKVRTYMLTSTILGIMLLIVAFIIWF